MNTREKTLAALVGVAVVLWLANQGLTRFRSALDESRSELSDVEQELSQARTARQRGLRAQGQLHQWRKRSLPTNPDIANSLYQDWLQQQLVAAGLEVRDLKSTSSLQAQSDTYQEFSYNVTTQGTLGEVVAFLHKFYEAGHLHRISKAALTPATEGEGLAFTLTVDALMLPEVDRTDELSSVASGLALPDLDEVRERVVGRNVFAAYSAGDTDDSPRTSRSDEASEAVVTGMTYGTGGWHMAVRMNGSGEIRHFSEGDTVRIGSFRGRILELDGRTATLQSRRGRLRVELGQKLSEAQPVADESS